MIIVGVDGNEPSERAARTAADLAQATGARLHVVCAYPRNEVAEVEDAGRMQRISIAEESARIAAEVAGRITRDPSRTTSSATRGRPAEVLVAEAERLSADLIVVGNKRVQSLVRALGTVAGAVAAHAPCDVYVAYTN
ncbi:universal stress protein [Nocardioides deserti]|uniref:Universal stress protein n=1 Tax=Nocardioides deserti TaxID=1588644 RepID=A0ABR6U6G3_9ACTN|nr:universal stress protein [Nocardioides deserti]MBC2960021.1 universal stress protein [Nocardioides deserti]